MRPVSPIILCFFVVSLSGCGSSSSGVRNPSSGNSTSTLAPTLAGTLSATRAPTDTTSILAPIATNITPAPIEASTTLAPIETSTTPEPSTTPASVEPSTTPATVEPSTTPATVEPSTTPAPIDPSTPLASITEAPQGTGAQLELCPICQDPIHDHASQDTNLRQRRLHCCGGRFHVECIGNWLRGRNCYGDRNIHCPLCRRTAQ